MNDELGICSSTTFFVHRSYFTIDFMADPVTRWKFVGIVVLAWLLAMVVFLYTDSDGLALLCASLVGAAAILLVRHYNQPNG